MAEFYFSFLEEKNIFVDNQWFPPQGGEKLFMGVKDVRETWSILNALELQEDMIRNQKMRKELGTNH